MTRDTTIGEARNYLLNGWLVSLGLHSLLLCAAVSWPRHSPTTMPTDLFQWDVTIVQSTQRQEKPALLSQNPAQLIGTAQIPQATTTTSLGRTSVARPTIASVQPTANKPITAALQAEPLSSVAQTIPPTESPFTESAQNVPQTADVALQPPNPLPNTTIQTPAAVETPSYTESDPASDPVQPVQPHAIASFQRDTASPSRADYSWLERMIFQRLEELKRASRPQLNDVRPMKVLVKAVVSNEGNLLASEIVKSSGLPHIDQEAMALVQRAFPMQFDRPLDRQQIAMRIPITYSQE